MSTAQANNGPLAGVRVLDLSRILAGPWSAQTLADLGAEVIKVERPESGDDTRSWGPPYAHDVDGNPSTDAAYFMAANRGKKSIELDITSAAGQAKIRELVQSSDVLLENYKVGGLSKYGLDYASLKALNSGLVYCSITGFGQSGPYKQRPGYDFMIQAMGGLMSVTGTPDSSPGGGPVKVGVAVADLFTGLYATIGILAALRRKEATGQGEHVDIALMDTQVAVLANQSMNYLTSGKNPERLGNAHPNVVPYEAFATADGHLVLAVGNDGQFARFCDVAGRPSLATDPLYLTNPLRVANRASLVPQVASAIAEKTTKQWIELLAEANVPCGPINQIADVFADPQVQARGLALNLPHAEIGSVPSVANPIRFVENPIQYPAGPPLLGQHNDEFLD